MKRNLDLIAGLLALALLAVMFSFCTGAASAQSPPDIVFSPHGTFDTSGLLPPGPLSYSSSGAASLVVSGLTGAQMIRVTDITPEASPLFGLTVVAMLIAPIGTATYPTAIGSMLDVAPSFVWLAWPEEAWPPVNPTTTIPFWSEYSGLGGIWDPCWEGSFWVTVDGAPWMTLLPPGLTWAMQGLVLVPDGVGTWAPLLTEIVGVSS